MTAARAHQQGDEEKGIALSIPNDATPAMRQYFELKAQYPGALLFYRMGDFYELFFEDAKIASATLDIALTHRGSQGGQPIPMCGVPAHSHEGYLHRLIQAGHKVAIGEQMEDPASARARGGYKAVIRRDVVRLVTPGTLCEDGLLSARQSNYLAAIARVGAEWAVAWLDISTGSFSVSAVEEEGLLAELAALSPSEILLSDQLSETELGKRLGELGARLSWQPVSLISSESGRRRLLQCYELTSLDSFGALGRADCAACGMVLGYVELTQRGVLPRLERLQKRVAGSVMGMDAATRRNLEITAGTGGGRKGSLLETVDMTLTACGGRLLAARLSAPSTDRREIGQRHAGVQWLLEETALRDQMRGALARCPDMERALGRISLQRGGPRDVQNILAGLQAARAIREQCYARSHALPDECGLMLQGLNDLPELAQQLNRLLSDTLPLLARDGGFIRAGAHPALDELRGLRDNSRQHIAALQEKYKGETGIPTLKIKHNNVLGYFIEVTKQHEAKVGESFIHRQSMKDALRYATPELVAMEQRLREASDKALALEMQLFEEMCGAVMAQAEAVAATARALAALDVAASSAELAARHGWSRPEMTEDAAFSVEAGQHPVVARQLELNGEGRFIPNDCDLSEAQRLWLLTGPNMAGKSTFLRQNALIAILAQAGLFVPAKAARIGVVDRLFSRVGASDDLARGRSTFMVEMVETATILNLATERSLVILDEIGRGTATYDGLSIAWAVVEYLHERNRCRALFATHYHELTQLAGTLPRLSPRHMKVKEWQGDVVFLHEVAEGSAAGSYGIHVAKLAGLPAPVLKRAREILTELEKQQRHDGAAALADSLPLFRHADAEPETVKTDPLREAVAAVDPDAMSPKDALEALYRLKGLL